MLQIWCSLNLAFNSQLLTRNLTSSLLSLFIGRDVKHGEMQQFKYSSTVTLTEIYCTTFAKNNDPKDSLVTNNMQFRKLTSISGNPLYKHVFLQLRQNGLGSIAMTYLYFERFDWTRCSGLRRSDVTCQHVFIRIALQGQIFKNTARFRVEKFFSESWCDNIFSKCSFSKLPPRGGTNLFSRARRIFRLQT